MSVKQIFRVYYDLPQYTKPAEVSKAFTLMDKRFAKIEQIKAAVRQKTEDHLKDELSLIDGEIELIGKIICPPGIFWSISEHRAQNKKFWVMLLTKPITEELPTEGQD